MRYSFTCSGGFKIKYTAHVTLLEARCELFSNSVTTRFLEIYIVSYFSASISFSLSSVSLHDDLQETIVAFQYIHSSWYLRQSVDGVNLTRKIAFRQHSNKCCIYLNRINICRRVTSQRFSIRILFSSLLFLSPPPFVYIKGILEMEKDEVNSSALG